MGKHVRWIGFGVRKAHGYTWTSGVVHWIEDDNTALDLLTQPGERFEEVPRPLTDVEGVGEKQAGELTAVGIETVEELAALSTDESALRQTLEQLQGVSKTALKNWSRAAGKLLTAKE